MLSSNLRRAAGRKALSSALRLAVAQRGLALAATRTAAAAAASRAPAAGAAALAPRSGTRLTAAVAFARPVAHYTTAEVAQKQTALLLASGKGDLKAVQEAVKQGADVNIGDYDNRRAIHIAAAEGKPQVCEWLLKNGANLTVLDRWGNTALDDAIEAKHGDIIKILRKGGAKIGPKNLTNAAQLLCTAAGAGDLAALQRLLDAGIDVNASDYDKRTPLHLAASEGKTQAVEFLLKNKAAVNAVDRFGNTPLSDALRGRGRSNNNVAKILEESGGSRGSPEFTIKNVPHVRGSISRMLPHLLQKYNFNFSEAWLPTDDDADFQLLETWTADKDLNAKLPPTTTPLMVSNNPKTHLGAVYRSKKAMVLDSFGKEEQLPQLRALHSFDNVKTGVVAPVVFNDTVVAVVKLYSGDARKFSDELLAHITDYMTGNFTAGVFKGEMPLKWDEVAELPKGQMNEVFRLIVAEEVFNANLVYAEVDWFYHLGLQKYYFQRFDAHTIAKHVHSFIAAKKLAATTGNPEDIWLDHQTKAADGSTKTALFMTPTDHAKMVHIETRLQEKIAKIPSSKPYTLEFFLSENTIVPHGSKKLGLYALQTSDWANPSKLGTQETSIWEVASEMFLRDKTKAIRDRYQDLITKAMAKLAPVVEVYDTYRDGTTPIMFAFAQSTGTSTSYMLQLTELLRKNALIPHRKFVETMANGIIVYSLYLKPCDDIKKRVNTLLQQFSMLHLVPQSPLTPLFLNGTLSAESYTYASAVAKFVYYFLNKRSEEFNQLAKAMEKDALNLGRLRLLQSRLKREAVSRERIFSSLIANTDLIPELYDHFKTVATVKNPAEDVRKNVALAKRLPKSAVSEVDVQILNAFVTFNQHVLKTNFYNKSKSALSFRLDPRFLLDSDFAQLPYGVFFLMGAEFQGFHVRFSDIARGGIRIIRSGDKQAYNHNLEGQFQENYGLAFTQNLKNKDIPEFGSKGTVLLNPGDTGKDGRLIQPNSFLAFQKYVSGLLDLLVPNEGVVDNYGKEEILFLGPDEGSADFMEWAAKYSEKRGYKWWRSFTTGKPPAMGGVPHDTYGMTTRGVHQYVVNCLAKMNLDESKVTKLQTGGPDGDLGSNEILLSKDKTIAIVDGSGVVYDPVGLNREELTRLAKKRSMINGFDLSKLSKAGFRVLTSDKNVTLPNGEVVESGLAFRNDFHLHPLAAADMFVPCGGRPESVNLTNVRRLLDKDGKPRFKIIVEGANLFLTQDARLVLEEAGVVLYKDASANKGGVTSSSLEVLAALALNDAEFTQHMAATDPKNPPAFYRAYVEEIQQRIASDANLEFECIWREHQRTGIKRFILTDQVSNKINELNDFVQQSSLYRDEALRRLVLAEAIPKQLQKLVGLDKVIERVPPAYLRAIFGAYLASRYVYRHGLAANEFAFFEFMQPYLKR